LTKNSNNEEVYNISIEKGLLEKIGKLEEFITQFMVGIINQIGPATAGGAIGAKALKITSLAKMPWGARLLAVGASSITGVASVKIGLHAGESILTHVNFKEALKQSRYGDPTINRVPSPDMTLIHSSIESGDFNSPLENVLECQFEINVLLILVLIILSFIMMYNFLNNKSKDKVYKIKEINSNTLNTGGL
jgi:hypothetical protein